MTDYVKMALEARKKVTKLTLKQQYEVMEIFEDVIESLSNKAGKAKSKSLTKRWLTDYLEEIAIERIKLRQELHKTIENSIRKAAEYGAWVDLQMFAKVAQIADIDLGPHFKDMFSKVQKSVIESIITGGLYKDKRSLSKRIWIIDNELGRDIQYVVNTAIIEKKSAIELARDLEKYVKEPSKRPGNWGKAYPNLRSRKVDYNAQRLARTTINHSYQTSSIKSSGMNPFVEGIEWRSALIHGRTCDLCMKRHGKVFPKDDVPLDHPNGLCTMIPYIPKSIDKVAGELRDWIDGGNNKMLDEWYNKYGDYFAFKRL